MYIYHIYLTLARKYTYTYMHIFIVASQLWVVEIRIHVLIKQEKTTKQRKITTVKKSHKAQKVFGVTGVAGVLILFSFVEFLV